MAGCHVIHSEKPNAFLIIWEVILRFGLENHQSSTGFIRYFYALFWKPQNVVLLKVFDVSEMQETHSILSENVMDFDTFGFDFVQMAPELSLNDRVYKVFLSTLPVASKHCFTQGFLCFATSRNAFNFY